MNTPRVSGSSGRVVPAAVIRRVRMRAMFDAVGSDGLGWPPFAYDAADITSQEMGGWLPFLRSPDHEINRDRDRMVARARDLVRNDGWGTGAINRIVDNTIGAQFRLIAKPDYTALQALAKTSMRFGRTSSPTWSMPAGACMPTIRCTTATRRACRRWCRCSIWRYGTR